MKRNSVPVMVGDVAVGGDAPVSIQSMTNTDTRDVEATVLQINRRFSSSRYSCRAQERLDKYISLVELSQFKSHYPDELSGGMKQRASIARALAYGGDVLIMDEPFKGLHFELKKALMDFIISCRYQRKNFFFFITHDVEEALSLADEIYIF